MKKLIAGLMAVSLYSFAAGAQTSGSKEGAPTVIELFTSQSCSSCPPADKQLAALAARPDVIALSCHVTYWNHLHWQDTLSREICTQRQYDYSASLGRRGVFTPQMVINGAHSAVGSRPGDVTAAMKAGAKTAPARLELVQSGSALNIDLPQITGTAQLYMIVYGIPHTQEIKSGENRGRTVSYTNPVQDIVALGSWDGAAGSRSVALPDDFGGIAVIAQQEKAGAILAAGKL